MDIMTEQFIPIVAFIVELSNCNLLNVDYKKHYFNIDGPNEEKVIDCIHMIDDFQNLFFNKRICLRRFSVVPN